MVNLWVSPDPQHPSSSFSSLYNLAILNIGSLCSLGPLQPLSWCSLLPFSLSALSPPFLSTPRSLLLSQPGSVYWPCFSFLSLLWTLHKSLTVLPLISTTQTFPTTTWNSHFLSLYTENIFFSVKAAFGLLSVSPKISKFQGGGG